MVKRLVENITSDYIGASSALHKKNRVVVYVEGYDDIPFWRSVFDRYETPERRFEISTPARSDLAKGKRVVMQFIPQAGENLLLCVDSDFDYIFGNLSHQSRLVNNTPFLFQTYTYAVENYLCYAPSLHSLCVRATKNDERLFDFEQFLAEYSKVIFPVFVWYVYAARVDRPSIFTLSEFKNTVRINYTHIDDNGEDTILWLERQVQKKLTGLRAKYPQWKQEVDSFEVFLREAGIEPDQTYLYMQGHALLENVVSVVLGTVCNALRKQTIGHIMSSSRKGIQLNNELSSYNNALSDVNELLQTNTGFHSCFLFRKLEADLEKVFGTIGTGNGTY